MSTVGSYTVTYNVSDAAGNAGVGDIVGAVEMVRTVTVSAPADTMAPVITLTGSAAVTVEVGGTYTEAGASASDNVDGDLTGHSNRGGEHGGHHYGGQLHGDLQCE